MDIRDIPVPEIYESSSDFRIFLKLFELALTAYQYDTDNLSDLYDPLRCKKELLWMLCDTMGYKYDSRLPTAFNRLVLLYFMSMIRNKGSKNGITLAAEVNLAQLDVIQSGMENDINNDRLKSTSIPVNAVYVNPNPENGYIDVVYFSSKQPVDACLEYVRPAGMYLFTSAGVRYDAKSKISVDARLTNTENIGMSFGPTHVGHYRREDYARLQKVKNVSDTEVDPSIHEKQRDLIYAYNTESADGPNEDINPGYRALYNLQLCNNDHIVKALLAPIFELGIGIDPNSVVIDNEFARDMYNWDLKHHHTDEQSITPEWSREPDVYTSESDDKPIPAVNPAMGTIGDAILVSKMNDATSSGDEYSTETSSGNITKSNKKNV